MDQDFDSLFLIAAAALVLGTWLLVCHLLSRIGGWKEIASRYPAPDSFSGREWNFQSAVFRRGVRYNNCLKVSAGPMGVRFAPLFLFRPAHPPFFIPWPEVSGAQIRSSFGRWVRLQFSALPGLDCQVPLKLASRMEEASGGIWRFTPLS